VKIINIILLSFPIWLLNGQDEYSYIDPLFISLEMMPEEEYETVKITEFHNEELFEPINLQLLTHKNEAEFYGSRIRTTVCDDEICEIMHIRLFWDLVGNYVGYDTIAGHPLTKYDHIPFTSNDYLKLHQLLLNKGSILKFKEKEELIDKEKVKASDVVDGTTGATALEIKEEVVDGALYTSFTLWHIAYSGDIKNTLAAHTESIFTGALKQKFLNSKRDDYELFALRRFTVGDFDENLEFLFKALEQGTPLLKKFILKDLPDKLWNNEEIQNRICEMFSDMDINSRTLLLDKVGGAAGISTGSLEALSQHATLMSKNQIIRFLKVIKEKGGNETIKANLLFAKNDPKFKYGYIIQEYTGD